MKELTLLEIRIKSIELAIKYYDVTLIHQPLSAILDIADKIENHILEANTKHS